MKAAWVASPDSNLWPPWADLKEVGVNRLYYPALKEVIEQSGLHESKRTTTNTIWVRNHQCSDQYRRASLTQIPQFGIFRDLHWDGGTHSIAQGLADVEEDIDACEMAGNSPYMIDGEFPYRDGNFLLGLFAAIRHAFPDLLLSWTMEPMQGGWIKQYPALVKFVNTDKNMVVVGQTFGGNMEPYNQQKVRADLRMAGFLAARIRLFLDASKTRPPKWDGCLLSTESLVV